MSRKTKSSLSLKALEKRCEEVAFKPEKQVLVLSSPAPGALLGSAVLSSSLRRAGHLFHFAVCSPVEVVDTVNEFKEKYSHHSLLLVGVDLRKKKKLKKGVGYPILVGGSCESEQAAELSIGDMNTTAVSAYLLAKNTLSISEYETSLAAAGALLEESTSETRANMELVEQAKDDKIVEERAGLRLVGADRSPLNQLLLHSIRPFLRGVSGNRAACDEILTEAEIPTPKFDDTISSLKTKELQNLTKVLISRIPEIIPYLEPDYVLSKEDRSSPLRSITDVGAGLETSWVRREFGAIFGVLLGDRGPTLRSFLDTQSGHQKGVVDAVLNMIADVKDGNFPENISLEVDERLLPDIGRVILDLGLVPEGTSIISLVTSTATELVWSPTKHRINHVLNGIKSVKEPLVTTSSCSIRFAKLPDTKREELRGEIAKAIGGK
jgi:hypothetical protein